jgi:hypothetical protein
MAKPPSGPRYFWLAWPWPWPSEPEPRLSLFVSVFGLVEFPLLVRLVPWQFGLAALFVIWLVVPRLLSLTGPGWPEPEPEPLSAQPDLLDVAVLARLHFEYLLLWWPFSLFHLWACLLPKRNPSPNIIVAPTIALMPKKCAVIANSIKMAIPRNILRLIVKALLALL